MGRWVNKPVFEDNIAPPDQNGCELWTGRAHKPSGYPLWCHNGTDRAAHRFRWAVAYGPPPDGYDVHHLCGVKRCCNLDHLKPMSRHDHQMLHKRPQGL